MAFLCRCPDARVTDRRGGHALTRRGRLAVDRRRGRRRGPRQRRPRRSMQPSRRSASRRWPARRSSRRRGVRSPRPAPGGWSATRRPQGRAWRRGLGRDVMSSQTRAATRVSVVLENAGDEVVTARLGRARAAGVRRVVTEGLVDMGDTGGPGHAAGTPAAAVMVRSRSPRAVSLALEVGLECVRRRRNGRERGFRRADRRARSGFGGAGWQMTAWPVPRAPSTRWPPPRGPNPH